MRLEDLLKLQAEKVESDVAKLAGLSSPFSDSPAQSLPTDKVLKLASLCDMAAEQIKIAESVGDGVQNTVGLSKVGIHSPVGNTMDTFANRIGHQIEKRNGTAQVGNSALNGQNFQKASGKKGKVLSTAMTLLSMMKSSSLKKTGESVDDTLKQLTGVHDQANKEKRQEKAAELMGTTSVVDGNPPTNTAADLDVSTQTKAPELPDAVKLAEARAVLAKVAETGCTCNGEGTCSYCRMKTAFARNIGGGEDEQVYNENGREPDAASLSIRT